MGLVVAVRLEEKKIKRPATQTVQRRVFDGSKWDYVQEGRREAAAFAINDGTFA